MAMGKRAAARQAAPMWVDTADLRTSDGRPYFERLNRVLADSGFDAFVEELSAALRCQRVRCGAAGRSHRVNVRRRMSSAASRR